MSYHIDFETLSLEAFKSWLTYEMLTPGRKLLLESKEENFMVLTHSGFTSVQSLLKKLKKKENLLKLSQSTGIQEKYLIVLSREIRSWIPKQEKLADFPEINDEIIEQLESIGIKNTKQLWEQGIDEAKRKNLLTKGISDQAELLKLVCLSDLCRVRWVNTTFAYILFQAGVRTAYALSIQEYENLHEKVVHLNAIHHWYRAKIGKNDFKLVIKAAGELSHELKIL